jgi:hypothetical protein
MLHIFPDRSQFSNTYKINFHLRSTTRNTNISIHIFLNNLVIRGPPDQAIPSVTPAKELQRDVVYLGWPVAPSYLSPNAGAGVGGLRGLSQWVKLYTGTQINFGDLTPYLTYSMASAQQAWPRSNPE